MKDLIALFHNVTSNKVNSIKYFLGGISNNNYLINDAFMIRIPKSFRQPFLDATNEIAIEGKLNGLPFTVQTLYLDEDGIKISAYQKNARPINIKKLNKNEIILIADTLKEFHQLKIKAPRDFDPFIRLRGYQGQQEVPEGIDQEAIIENAKKWYEKQELFLCHNDLVFGNILFDGKQVFLIDYEYVGNNLPVFDLISFISENNITDSELISIFLNRYYDNNIPDNFKKMAEDFTKLLDLLWYYWASLMYKKTGDEVFVAIFEQKLHRLQSL